MSTQHEKAPAGNGGQTQEKRLSSAHSVEDQPIVVNPNTTPPTEKPLSSVTSHKPLNDYEFRDLVDRIKRRASMRGWLIFLGVVEKTHNKFLCPFHREENPSFSVHESDAYATDFHDDEKYDHIKIAREMNGWDFWTALERLADFIGETLPKRSNGKKRKYQIKHVKGEFSEAEIRRGFGNKVYVREHDYYDEDNKLLYKKVIYVNPDGKKDPLFYHPGGNGSWKPKRGCESTLYMIVNLVNSDVIYYVEGEKDVETLAKLGIPAVTCGSAADTKTLLNPGILDKFKGKKVIVLYDNDAAGIKHTNKVATLLKPVASSVKVVQLPGVAEGEDVTDWLNNRGGTREELLSLVDATEEYVVPAEPPTVEYHLTEFGNAARFRDDHREKLCYVYESKTWYVWNGNRWLRDTRGITKLLGKQTIGRLYEEGKADRDDPEQKKWKHAKNSESNKKVEAMISLAQPDFSVEQDVFDRDKYLLTVRNGTIDLNTMEFRDSQKEDYITKSAGTHFDPDAECPVFRKFLSDVLLGNEDLIKYLQRIFGYCLTGETYENAAFFFYGSGANGKSTLITLISEVLGDYANSVSPQALMHKDKNNPGQANSEIAKLRGARLVSTIEATQARILDESLIKQLTGGDLINARFLFQNEFSFRPEFKIIFGTNHMPVIRGTDHAIWRRIHKIPFNALFEGKNKDGAIAYRLAAEKPGVLNWMLEGYQMWRDKGLCPPTEVIEATREYREDMDVIVGFLAECCDVMPSGSEKSTDLYHRYESWCVANGEYCLKQKQFSMRLVEKNFRKGRGNTGAVIFIGIRLKPMDTDT